MAEYGKYPPANKGNTDMLIFILWGNEVLSIQTPGSRDPLIIWGELLRLVQPKLEIIRCISMYTD